MAKGPVIDVGFTGDINSFISDIKKKLGSVKGIGLDKAFDHDIADMIKMLSELQTAFDNIGKSKVNTSSFAKAQKEITDKIQLLETRTTALEDGMAQLISTMSKADGGKFAKELQEIIVNMSTLQDVTVGVSKVIQQVSDANINTSGLDKVLDTLKSISDIRPREITEEDIFGDFKTAKKNIIGLYNEINKKKKELANTDNSSEEGQLHIAELQKQIVQLGNDYKSIFNANYEIFGEQFDEAIIKIGKMDGAFFDLEERIDSILNNIKNDVQISIEKINSNINDLSFETSTNGKQQLSVPLVISTKESTLLKRAEEIIDTVSNSLQDKPIQVSIVLASAWGTRKSNEIFKDFQNQIDNLSKSTDVTELRKLADDASNYLN